MIVDCISDLHGFYPQLEGGDLLIVAGDVTNNDSEAPFSLWIDEQKYEKIIWIAGNHDNLWYESWLEHGEKRRPHMHEGKWKGPERNEKIEYLCDNGTIFKGLKIWGSPWTRTFEGMNPQCKAFTLDTEEELAEKWVMIPKDIDILITHSPPYGILDKVAIKFYNGMTDRQEHAGSHSLLYYSRMLQPRFHIFGHIHEAYGQEIEEGITNYVNASHVNESYKPVNKPIRIEL